MSGKRSRWDEDEEQDAEIVRQKAEKEAKKKAKLAKKLQDSAIQEPPPLTATTSTPPAAQTSTSEVTVRPPSPDLASSRGYTPSKRRRISPPEPAPRIFPLETPTIVGCRSVDIYEKLNHIEEGSYGIVYRAKDTETGDIVALKKLKLEREKNGFPITSLREISTLMAARHPNIVNIREIVMGDSLSQYRSLACKADGRVFIVMDFIEHDLKALMENMREPFLQSEVKTLMLQLLSATALMHELWIIHRDLKTSNLLMTNRGMMKIADFGLARYFGEPVINMTQLVVTLWAPELLLGTKEYGTEIDMWSIGCIFGELLLMEPLLQGKSEIDQLAKIFELVGVPTEETWPGFKDLPNAQNLNFPKTRQTTGSLLRARVGQRLTTTGTDLLSSLLTLDPNKRISAKEALEHPYFKEDPKPKHPEFFPSFPSKGSGEKRKRWDTPEAPKGGGDAPILDGEKLGGLFRQGEEGGGPGFMLKFG